MTVICANSPVPDQRNLAPNTFPQKDGNVVRGRAAVLRDAVSRHAGPDGSHVSAFDGAVQDTDTEMDLWQGVDAVVMCVGRGAGGVGAKRTGGAARGGCEDLVRFVSHKCVLHGKPLVWGWAGGAGEGGAGVEVRREDKKLRSSDFFLPNTGYRIWILVERVLLAEMTASGL